MALKKSVRQDCRQIIKLNKITKQKKYILIYHFSTKNMIASVYLSHHTCAEKPIFLLTN